jgi:hypothetical protein
VKTLLIRLFLQNWPRKLVSLILAIIIWIIVSNSMTVTKVIPNIPIRVVNLPEGKTIEGMQVNGLLNKRISITLVGHKTALDELLPKDLEILIDAKDKSQEWIASIDKKNLVSLNPDFDVTKVISRVVASEMIIRQSTLVTEKIPVTITQPIGEAPRGYQFLDIWPYQLFLTVNGPEETVKRLKNRGLKLTFNLNDILPEQLDTLWASTKADEMSFAVPDSWKKVTLPLLSESPIEIDDPQAKSLRIDFSKQDILPIGFSLPVTIFFPPKYSNTLNPETYSLATNNFISKKNGIKLFSAPLYAQGVSHQFLEAVKDMIEIVIIASPKSERETLLWSTQFMYPHELEDRYIAKIMSQSNDEVMEGQPHLLEEYLRNRFRNYMSRFRLYTPNKNKLSLKIELQANSISVTPQNYP